MTCGKFLKRWDYQTTLLVSYETCMWVKKWQLEADTEQMTGSKLENEYDKAVCCHPAYLTYMQSTSWETLDWMKHKLEQDFRRNYNLRYANDTPLMSESEEELKSLLMRVKEDSKKSSLKLSIQKTKIMASGPITSWQVEGGKIGNNDRLYFLGLQNHCG